MSAMRAILAALAFVSIGGAVVVTCVTAPAAGAADATIEAESMSVNPASAGRTVRDSAASGGAALTLSAAATASTTIALPASASIVVSAKGQQCNGVPTMSVLVDGKTVSTTKVSSSWATYPTTINIAAGSHTIGLAFTNPYRFFFCTRSLSLDRVTIVAVAPTTTTTTTTTTTSTTTPTTTTTSTTASTTPTSTSATSTTSSPPPPSGDTTAWLQSRFDALKAGETLTLEPRTYQHSGVLKLRAAGARVNGNGATFQSTNDSTSAVQILADNVQLSNLTLSAPLTGTRYDSLNQHKLVIQGRGDTVTDVTISGSAASGIFVYGASNFTLTRVTVRNSRADGIHMTNGANNGQVNNATTEATGDDGIAVVSYGSEPICHDIVVNSPRVNGTTWGRGISVVGGQKISYRNIAVSASNAAGVYIASEGDPYYTLPVSTVDVTGGTVTGATTSTQVVHGAVLVYSGNSRASLSGVTISGLTISNTPKTAYRNVGIVLDAGSVSGISLTNIALQNTQAVPFAKTSNVSSSSYTTSGWTLNGTPINVG